MNCVKRCGRKDRFKVCMIMMNGRDGRERMMVLRSQKWKTSLIEYSVLGNYKSVSSQFI